MMKNQCVSCKGEYTVSAYILPLLPNGDVGYCASCRKEVMQLEKMYGEPASHYDNVDYNGSINMLERRFNQWRHVEKKVRIICEVIAQINQYR